MKLEETGFQNIWERFQVNQFAKKLTILALAATVHQASYSRNTPLKPSGNKFSGAIIMSLVLQQID